MRSYFIQQFRQDNYLRLMMEWSMLLDSTEKLATLIKVFKADEGIKQSGEKLETYLQSILS
jgi:hypothetical protein